MKTVLSLLLFVGLSFIAPGSASAQSYPTGPVTIVVPYPPGGQIDALARLVQQKIQPVLGQPVMVENRAGAGGNIGTASAMRAAPDGHTIVLTTDGVMVVAPHLYQNLGFDPLLAAPITIASETVVGIALHNSVPAKNIPELIAYAKANPGKVTYAAPGLPQHIMVELLKKLGDADIQYVPYKGGAPALSDLVGGHIKAAAITVPSILPHLSTGSIRVIAVSGKERFPQLPDAQTVSETYPEVQHISWTGFFAPPGTPKPIIDRLNEVLTKALKDPEVVEKLSRNAEAIVASDVPHAEMRVKEDLAKWRSYLQQVKINTDR